MMDWSKYYPANWTAVTAEDVRMIREKKLAPVDKDAVKQDWKDRSDDDHVDIDKDGDEDNSDKFLHKKRKAVKKSMKKDNGNGNDDDVEEAASPTKKSMFKEWVAMGNKRPGTEQVKDAMEAYQLAQHYLQIGKILIYLLLHHMMLLIIASYYKQL